MIACINTFYRYIELGMDLYPAPDQRLPFPSARNDQERTENILWLIEHEPEMLRYAGDETSHAPDSAEHDVSNLFGLIGTANANRRVGGYRAELSVPELIRLDMWRYWTTRLMRAEVNNPYLSTIAPPNYIPSAANTMDIAREASAAEQRLRFGAPPREFGYLGPRPLYRWGDSEDAILGRAGHIQLGREHQREGYEVNAPLRNRAMFADAVRVNQDSVNLREFKPANLRSIERGIRQMNPYEAELARIYLRPVDSRIVVYNPQTLFRDAFGLGTRSVY